MNIKKEFFGKTRDKKDVFLFTITNKNNITVTITNFGGIITSLFVPDKKGKTDDVVLGFNTLEEYLNEKYFIKNIYFGSLIGRYANRIAKGIFNLNGKEYKLATNDHENHMHGGVLGFDKVVWDVEKKIENDETGIILTYLSKDQEEGYPGNLNITVSYILNNENEIKISYKAMTDQPTIISLTQHSYFNLAGKNKNDIYDHELIINADRFTEIDKNSIPTGELKQVKGTAMDFTSAMPIGSRINKIKFGYDHNYVLNKINDELSLAAKIFEPESGRMMELYTTEPGIQFYSGNSLDGTLKGKYGKYYKKHSGFCLEAQHFPDSPNHPGFPNTILNPGDIYRQLTIYKFII